MANPEAYSVVSVSPIESCHPDDQNLHQPGSTAKDAEFLRLGSGDPLRLCGLSRCPIVFHSAWAAVPHDAQEHVRTSLFFCVHIHYAVHAPCSWLGPMVRSPHTHTHN